MNKKFELLEEQNGLGGYRIRALRGFSDVSSGDLGGFVTEESCLDAYDDSWVYDESFAKESKICLNSRGRFKAHLLMFAWEHTATIQKGKGNL